MKEEKIIYQLKKLKKLEPSPKTLSFLKRTVFSQVRSYRTDPTFDQKSIFAYLYNKIQFRPAFFYGALAFTILAIIVILPNRNLFLEKSQAISTKAQIVFTSNDYEKAKLAFNLSLSQLNDLKHTDYGDLDLKAKYISDSTTQTDSYINSLSLKGELGKYTKDQCLSLYRSYYTYLEGLKKTVDAKLANTRDVQTQNQLQTLLNQISGYEKQVNNKLNLY